MMHSLDTSGRLWRSVLAIIAGALVGALLSVATDFALHASGIAPALGQRFSNPLLLLAVIYRTLYGILGSYLCARLAPILPMRHSIILGWLGLAANLAGAIATWNAGPAFGPHWYPITLVLLALPTAWLGARIFIAQQCRARA